MMIGYQLHKRKKRTRIIDAPQAETRRNACQECASKVEVSAIAGSDARRRIIAELGGGGSRRFSGVTTYGRINEPDVFCNIIISLFGESTDVVSSMEMDAAAVL